MPPSLKGNKVTTVPAAADLTSILDAAVGDEPEPTAEAERLIEEARSGNVQIPGAAGGPPLGVPAGAAAEGGAAGPDPVDERDPDAAAASANALFWSVAAGVGGDEWQPDDQAEYDQVQQAWATYFSIRGTPPLPPELILAGALGGVAFKRIHRPKTRERLGPFMARVPVIGRLFAPPPPPAPVMTAAATSAAAAMADGPFLRE